MAVVLYVESGKLHACCTIPSCHDQINYWVCCSQAAGNSLAVYDLVSCTRLSRHDMKSATVEMAFSPDGIMLVLVLEVSLGYHTTAGLLSQTCGPSFQPLT